MPVDMKQFHSVFFEESQEHLDDMEQLLLNLDVSEPDAEDLNSIFRAAHSIKGGSGIFGFNALGSVTHVMESLLDNIRQQKMAITSDLVDLFLKSVDVLKAILSSYRTHQDVDWSAAHTITIELEHVTSSASSAEPEVSSGTVSNKEAYGFFSDDFTVVEDEGYGFFDEPISSNRFTSDKDGAYGFFDDTSPTGSDASYGFFDDAFPISPIEIKKIDERVKANHLENPALDEIALNAHSCDVGTDLSSAKFGKKPTARPKAVEVANTESNSIRVDVSKVDQLINLVGEIVITQSMLSLLGKNIDGALAEKFQSIANELERNTREIQEAVMSIRMLPVSFVFNRFPRVVRDLSQKLGKSIDLVIEGGETELDKGLTEKLVDPLTHLVRNSIDHGIESAEVRSSRGKRETGTVTLRASQAGGSIVISIADDGGGLNREKILAKAREKSIPVDDNPSDGEVWQLIFAPGFSTATEITDVSGRGVGLDVVKRNVQGLGGRIDIESIAGVGATFTIHLPLTLAIVDGMCVSVGDQTFIIPLVNIVESLQPMEKDIKTLAVEGQLLLVRDEYWPILALYKAMELTPRVTEPHKGIVVLVEADQYRFALLVDGLVGQQQVVIKSLEQHYKRVQGVAGATIMGDGSVALILDVGSLAMAIHHDS